MDDNNSQFKKIITGNGFQNDLIATTNDRLEMTVTSLQQVDQALRSNLMFLQSDVQNLTDTIKKANDKNDRAQKWFLILGILGTILAATQLVQVIDILIRGIGK